MTVVAEQGSLLSPFALPQEFGISPLTSKWGFMQTRGKAVSCISPRPSWVGKGSRGGARQTVPPWGAVSCRQALGLALPPSPAQAPASLHALGMSVLLYGFS